MPYIRLAKLKKGRVWVNSQVPKKYRNRLKIHMKVYKKARAEGASRTDAIRQARIAEHCRMNKRQIQKYEGELGAIARYGGKRKKS